MMVTLLVIIVLGLAENTHGEIPDAPVSSVMAPCPFKNSSYMSWIHYTNSSVSHAKTVLQLVQILQWKHIIIFYDDAHSNDIQLIRPFLGLATVHDLGEFQHMLQLKNLLKQLHQKFFPTLQFLLLSSYNKAMEVLKIVDSFDLESNRTTDFRHHSFWMVASYSQCEIKTSRLPDLHHLENVILLCFQRNGCSVYHQLVTSPGGRSLSAAEDTDAITERQEVFPNTKNGLNNMTLIVSTVMYDAFVIKRDDGFNGYLIEVLDSIAATLNFSYKIVHPVDRGWGQKVNGRWNGLVGQLERREVDLAVADLTIHEDRDKVMDFLYPPVFTEHDDIMYKLQSEDTERWQMYRKPFTSLVLVTLFVSLVASSVIGYILYRCDDASTQHKRDSDTGLCISRLYTITDTFLYLLGILLLRSIYSKPRNQSTRFLVFTWGVFCLIIAAIYSANLVAIFVIHKPTLPFTSLGELVRQDEYKWGFPSGDIREHIYKGSRTGDMKLAWEGILKFNQTDPEVLSEDYSIHIDKVKSEKYVFIVDRHTIQRVRSNDCNIRHIKQVVTFQQFGIGVPTDYPLKRELEEILSVIMDSGLPDIWWRRWDKATVKECAEDRVVNTLTLPVVVSAFYLLCVGIGAAGVALLIEFITYKHRSRCLTFKSQTFL